jgi:hypothetical protein
MTANKEHISTFQNITIQVAIIGFCILIPLYSLNAAKKKKTESIFGVISEVNEDTLDVYVKRGKKTHTLTMTSDTSKIFIGDLINTKEIKKGYPVRAHVNNSEIGKIYVTKPIKDVTVRPTPEMVKMTPKEVFEIVDLNEDNAVSYVEFSAKIHASIKHGPVQFSKSDKDKSGGLNLKEFEYALENHTKWWKYSRKTSDEWFKSSDKDSNGVLNEKEFEFLLGSDAHMEVFFPRADKDESGDLDKKEVSNYIQTLIYPKVKKNKGKKK